MSVYNTQREENSRFAIRIIVAIFVMILWWGAGEFSVDWVAGQAITWLRTTTIGILTIGSGGVLSMTILDKLLVKFFKQYDKDNKSE